MPDERDFEKNPYSADEMRVVAWINENLGVGGGDDPIGFLLASHRVLAHERAQLARELEQVYQDAAGASI